MEECCSGVVYCQIVDSVHPGSIPKSKLKTSAKTEVDFIHNFKLLQTAFSKNKIDRAIEVDKLSKKSFQMNMEFLQFMKCYWDMHAPNGGGVNGGVMGDLSEAAANYAPVAEQQPAAAAKPAARKRRRRSSRSSAAARSASLSQQQRARGLAGGAVQPGGASGSGAGGAGGMTAAQQEQLAEEVGELKLSVENLERERDFYYSKLREVEVLCQENEDSSSPFLQQVLDILYKTDDADEFVTPDENGAVPAQ